MFVLGERSKHGLAGHEAIYLAAVSQTSGSVAVLPSTDVAGKCLFSLQGILVVSSFFSPFCFWDVKANLNPSDRNYSKEIHRVYTKALHFRNFKIFH